MYYWIIKERERPMDRTQLQLDYIRAQLDDMSVEELAQFFIETMDRDLNDLDDEELENEVSAYYPQLLQD